MKTKTQGGSRIWLALDRRRYLPDGNWMVSGGDVTNTNTITYAEGPSHHPDGATNWKECTHTWVFPREPLNLSGLTWDRYGQKVEWEQIWPSPPSWCQDLASSETRRVKPPTSAELLHAAQYAMEGRLSQTLLPVTDLIQLVRKVDGLGSADALLTSLLAPFRAKPKTWSDLMKKVAGADLARKFGVNTLWQTITDAIKTGAVINNHLRKLERIQNSQQRNFKVSIASRHDGDTGVTSIGRPANGTTIMANYRSFSIGEASIHFRTSVRYDTSDALRTRLVWDALGLSNIFSTAWDLMPLSFVVDWIVRVQEFAERLDGYYFHTVPLERMTELQDVWVTETVKGVVELNGFHVSTRYPYEASLVDRSIPYHFTVGRFRRYPVFSTEMSAWLPSLRVNGVGITTAQSITGLELMIQRSF